MTTRALVYGDIDLNLIDGSAIWLQSVTQALAGAGCAVTLVLKAPVRTSRLIEPLLAEPGVTVRRPFEEHLLEGPGPVAAAAAPELLARLDAEAPHDLVVLRGRAVTAAAAKSGAFAGRLWPYLTDVPQSVPGLTPEAAEELAMIASAARYLLCQTEELRCFLEGSIPAACGKCVLLPPILAEIPASRDASAVFGSASPLRLVYSGKFAPRWNTLEMTELPGLLAARGVAAELHMIGDKIHNAPGDYQQRMRAALDTKGVTWHGGHSREDALRLAASCDIGLGWRHPELDASLELSTKVLEYGAIGLPVILNRTPMHEGLLGADYPLFAASLTDVVDVAAAAAADPALYRQAADRTGRAAQQFTLDRAAERLRGYLGRAVQKAPAQGAGAAPRLKVVVAGHDLKFFTPLLNYLRLQPELEVRLDQWAALGKHDADVSRELAGWADVVICEWCGPNAVWYSRHKRRGSRLLVRLHRFELTSPYPRQVKIGAVNQVICVSRHYARLTREQTGWPEAKVVTIPNAIDVAQLDRPKLDGARFHLGLVGIVPSRKRLDLALDVLEELRREDDRYSAVHQVGDAVGALVGVAEPGRTRALRRRAAPGAARPAAARRGGVRRRGTRRRGLAAPGRLHAVHQRRRELPRRPGRGDGVAGGPGAAALAGRRDHLRHALAPPEPRGHGRRDRRARRRSGLAERGRRGPRAGQRRVRPAARVRGLARPAHEGSRPDGTGADARAARLRLRRHVLHARHQRGRP